MLNYQRVSTSINDFFYVEFSKRIPQKPIVETSADQAVCLMAEDGEPVAGRPGA